VDAQHLSPHWWMCYVFHFSQEHKRTGSHIVFPLNHANSSEVLKICYPQSVLICALFVGLVAKTKLVFGVDERDGVTSSYKYQSP